MIFRLCNGVVLFLLEFLKYSLPAVSSIIKILLVFLLSKIPLHTVLCHHVRSTVFPCSLALCMQPVLSDDQVCHMNVKKIKRCSVSAMSSGADIQPGLQTSFRKNVQLYIYFLLSIMKPHQLMCRCISSSEYPSLVTIQVTHVHPLGRSHSHSI